MITIEKKRVTLSLPTETDDKLELLAKENGMTKSGLVNYLINKTVEAGNYLRIKKIQGWQALDWFLYANYIIVCLALQER